MAENIEQARTLRDQGIAAVRAGRQAEAQELLAQSVELNPNDEHAWLWLTATAETDEDRRFCLQRVLEINPASEAARKGLAKLPPPSAPAAAAPSAPPSPVLPATSQTIPLAPPPPAPLPPPPPAASAPSAPAPTVGGAASYYVPVESRSYSRPGCVTCLASCSFLTALFFIGMIFVVVGLTRQVANELDMSGTSAPTVFLTIAGGFLGVFALIYLVSGFGLWTGKRFAWWLTIFSFAYTIVSQLFSVLNMFLHKAEFERLFANLGPDNASAIFVSTIIITFVMIAISVLVIMMLFIPDTLGFFNLSRVNKQKALAIVFGLSVLLSLCFRPLDSTLSSPALNQLQDPGQGEQPFEP